jgi:uncharacterized membrane protein
MKYIFLKQAVWYWTTIALAIVTTIMVFTIPENLVPLAYLRSLLGIVFILFLPGFTFMKTMFPAKLPIKSSSDKIDLIMRIALSFGTSMALMPVIGLFLYYTTWSISLTSVTLSLLAFVVFFATAALLQERKKGMKARNC